MTDTPPKDGKAVAGEGVILRAENGAVIGYDETGLILRLSDRVVADLAARLALPAAGDPGTDDPGAVVPPDLDAWDIRRRGDWVHFMAHLPGRQGIRGYRIPADGGAVIADGRGPLLGILGIGGARAALGWPEAEPGFPFHILAPADDIGAVGVAGIEPAIPRDRLGPVRDMTHEALVARALLDARQKKGLSLPNIVVRVETDEATSAAALATGPAMQNLEVAAESLCRTARALGTHAKLLAITLDFALEDTADSPTAYRDGMIALMEEATRRLGRLGLAQPLFLATFDCGTHRLTESPALEGQWELSWNHAAHRLVHVAPGYMFAQDDTARLTAEGREARALVTAQALTELEAGRDWLCPRVMLAEATGKVIRLTCESLLPLTIDPADPFGAGPAAGFRLVGAPEGQGIKRVGIDPDDAKSVLLHCCQIVDPAGLSVRYAYGAAPSGGPYPPNAGALRDGWDRDGLHRWALPVHIAVTRGAGR